MANAFTLGLNAILPLSAYHRNLAPPCVVPGKLVRGALKFYCSQSWTGNKDPERTHTKAHPLAVILMLEHEESPDSKKDENIGDEADLLVLYDCLCYGRYVRTLLPPFYGPPCFLQLTLLSK
ncbi:hypothetical protein KQX54_011600 [Cotesia glomerata]|uniref:Uncharacterized protein n=1 Tax=Cotesia glomerata TaxID=32391 RepID=A0AAV7J6N6_COTGL|nr:hypothetical protein KQX54_011600 [Cotesia glomerata]